MFAWGAAVGDCLIYSMLPYDATYYIIGGKHNVTRVNITKNIYSVLSRYKNKLLYVNPTRVNYGIISK